ncbi:AGAP013031-PA [Anopheles gambiae str. PEST]|uniref:AGAP013031-PA n=1 Tax=Anopheles gambiae TaxID=7165 RepID=F5HMA9_ANOGA|nr:AGAP013031-PA [Anopheles gambiae str. PEST]
MNVTEESISPAETLDCRNYLPPLKLYYAEYIIPLSLSLTVGCIVWLWVTFVFVKVIKLIRRQTEKGQVMVLIIANTVYFTVVTFNVVALLVPHVAVVCDIVPFVAFCWCILVFFRYLKESVGGDSIIMGLYESKALDPPKVCPCFRFIYDRKRQLRAIRFGILQLPIYNSVVASIQLLIFSYDKDLFFDAFYIILPFIITSIVFYVGSSVSFIKTVAPLYPANPIFKRFFLLQLVLIITKPQIIILELIYNLSTFECTLAGEPKVYINIIKQLVILLEIAAVTICSYKFYTGQEPAAAVEKTGVNNTGYEA